MISQSLFFFAYIDYTESILVLVCRRRRMYLPYFGTQKRPVADSSGVWIKEEFFGLFFTCATLTVCVYRVEFLSRQTSISRWLILRGIFWKKQMHRSYLIFSQSEDHLIVIPLVDCDSPFGDHSIRKKIRSFTSVKFKHIFFSLCRPKNLIGTEH